VSDPLIIYGAYGYTGALISRLAQAHGLSPVLAGRNADKTKELANALGYEHCVFALDDKQAVADALENCAAVIHCAGPFSRTAAPMIEACIQTQTHYLDITGEISVFEQAAHQDAAAQAAGIMLMPGAGFDVVPSDCLAGHLDGRLPGAGHLNLAFMNVGGTVSRGTATTIVENLHQGSVVREQGKLKPIATGSRTRKIDFGRGERLCMAIPWGDVSTAWYSTGIPNIAVFTPVPRAAQLAALTSNGFRWLLGSAPVQRFLKAQIQKRPAGPTEEQRANGKCILWGEARDDAGTSVQSRLTTPEGYTLTAMTALLIAQKVLAGHAPAGFQTPCKAYGPDLILEIEGVTRKDV
jgi:short subunit dehydrogenase-like uncharacterized protein